MFNSVNSFYQQLIYYKFSLSPPPSFLPMNTIFITNNGAFMTMNSALINMIGVLMYMNGAFITINGVLMYMNGALMAINGVFIIMNRALMIMNKGLLGYYAAFISMNTLLIISNITYQPIKIRERYMRPIERSLNNAQPCGKYYYLRHIFCPEVLFEVAAVFVKRV